MSDYQNEIERLKHELEILQKRLSEPGNDGRVFDLFENHPYGYALCEVITDEKKGEIDFLILEINRALGNITGLEPEKVIGRSLKDLFPAARNSPFFPKVADIVNSRLSRHFEFWSPILSRWLDITVFSPGLPRFIATFMDITERKQTEQMLLKSQEAFRDMVENVNDALYSVDSNGIITYVSPAIKRILGYDPEELIGKSYVELIFPEDVHFIQEDFERVLNNILYPSEYRLLTKNGEIRWVRTSSRPFIEDKNVVGIRGVLVDISERKRAEEDLCRNEERYRLLFENASEIIANIDKDGRFLFLNKSAANFLGGATSDFEGKYIWEVFPLEGEKMYKNGIMRVINSGVAFITEGQYTVRGEPRWFRTNLQPVFDSNGKICNALIISNDIDAQKRIGLYHEARLQLLQQLHKAREIDECLKCGCQAIHHAGLYKRAVLTLHNHKKEIIYLGHIGLDEETVKRARKEPAPSMELAGKITQDKFRISHSYFIPAEAGVFSAYVPRGIPQEADPAHRPNAWLPSDELFVPVISNEDIIEGWLSVDTPMDGGRPAPDQIRYLEELVDITAQRVHEIQSLELLMTKRRALEDSNTAMRVLMAHIKDEKTELENKIGSHVVQTLLPALEKLVRKDGTVNKTHLSVLKFGLSELVSVSGATLQTYANLSPREREICNMIKAGSTSKDIADALDISLWTVKKHREMIRRKLGLINQDTSLWNFLNNI